ncbi:hypothetical protein pb186bvf_008626 [Paramecium bursaria]
MELRIYESELSSNNDIRQLNGINEKGILCIILGIISQTYQNDYSRYTIRYDSICGVIGQNCSITVQVSKPMKAPVFVSFELSGFFQNTDAYFQSRSQDQFYGNENFDSNECHPYITNKNMSKTISITGKPLNEDDAAIPCGVVAYTYMNGRQYFQIFIQDSYIIDGLTISPEGIAWAYDWIDMTDQRFINWVRVSGLSVMRKLWGVINQDVPAGTYTVTIQNNFDQQQYNGFKKYFLLHNDRTYDDPVLVVTLPISWFPKIQINAFALKKIQTYLIPQILYVFYFIIQYILYQIIQTQLQIPSLIKDELISIIETNRNLKVRLKGFYQAFDPSSILKNSSGS